nr:hypothetical protein [Tanacetum cinerariifolium]
MNPEQHQASPGRSANEAAMKPRVPDAKYFREQLLLAMKDEAGSNLNNEENDFMLDTSYREETMEELTDAVMLMDQIQPADGNAETVPSYDAKAVSEVNASSKVHEQLSQSLQTIHMLGKTPSKVYDPFLKAGLGYTNPKRLKKAIAAQQKREFYETDVILMSASLSKKLKELKEELIEEGKNVNTKFDKSETSETLLCVTSLPKNLAIKAKKVSNSKVNADRAKPVTSHPTPKNEQGQKQNENVLASGMYRITKTETYTPDSKTSINVSNSTGVKSSNSVRRPKSKYNKSKNRVLNNTNAKSSTAHVRTMLRSASIDSNKHETKNSNVRQSNASVLSTMTVNTANDGSNTACVPYGKDVFLLSHEKYVARYALSRSSSVKRAIFTTPQQQNLRI